MLDFFNPQFGLMVLAGIAAFATVITIALPALSRDRINSRMKVMATERDKMRAQRLAELSSQEGKGRLRTKPKGFMQHIVDQFDLRRLLETDDLRQQLKMAGMRGQAPVVGFLFFRLIMPFVMLAGASFYLFIVRANDGMLPILKIGISLVAAYVGFYLPNIFISNLIQRRQQAMKNAFPDALDLLLICVQAGMSIEAAFGKVANEISAQSIELAEEFSLTTAELSYLQDRRMAYDNLGKRTGLPMVKGVATALIQAERYGTPVSQALRVMAKENRDLRMAEAEKKAAALPPKLTVPMIVFFLPVLFVVILGPAIIRYMQMNNQ